MDVETELVAHVPLETAGTARTTGRARAVATIAPLTVAAGIAWAILQPYRITLLHPHGERLWFLLIEPPLLVIAAGILFGRFVARPLLADLEEQGDAP
jgi:hypothetical protein